MAETGLVQDTARLTTHRRFPKTLSTSGVDKRLCRTLRNRSSESSSGSEGLALSEIQGSEVSQAVPQAKDGVLEPCHQHSESIVPSLIHSSTHPCLPQIGDRNGELTARMNIAHLQLALGRLTSPAAAEKPDLAGYEAQGEL